MGAIIRWQVETSNVECVTVGSGMLEDTRAFGLLGGKSGSLPTMQVISSDTTRRQLRVNAFHAINEGDVCEIVSQGGGGFGDPFERDPEQIMRDVADELVSVDKAMIEYGVVIVGVEGAKTIDWQATKNLRLQRKSAALKAVSTPVKSRRRDDEK
jgi:N-methylhydantoinase B